MWFPRFHFYSIHITLAILNNRSGVSESGRNRAHEMPNRWCCSFHFSLFFCSLSAATSMMRATSRGLFSVSYTIFSLFFFCLNLASWSFLIFVTSLYRISGCRCSHSDNTISHLELGCEMKRGACLITKSYLWLSFSWPCNVLRTNELSYCSIFQSRDGN